MKRTPAWDVTGGRNESTCKKVTVTESPENKRNKIVQMTDAGRIYCEKVVRHITWAEDTAMSMFSPEEQKLLIDLSRTFTKNLTRLVNQETEDI